MRIPSLLPLAPLLLSLSPSFASSAASSDSDFANTAIVRTIDLAGATTVITTTYTAKCQASSSAGCKEYTLGLGARDVEKLAGLEVREKRKGGAAVGGGDLLEWKESGVAGSESVQLLSSICYSSLPSFVQERKACELVRLVETGRWLSFLALVRD
jgi:hypothetical protein